MVSRVMNSNENHTEILIQDSEPDLNLLAGAEEMSDVNDDEENDEYDEYVGDEEDQAQNNSSSAENSLNESESQLRPWPASEFYRDNSW